MFAYQTGVIAGFLDHCDSLDQLKNEILRTERLLNEIAEVVQGRSAAEPGYVHPHRACRGL